LKLVRLILTVTFILFLSPLVLYCTKGDGYEEVKDKTWLDVIDKKFQKAYELYEKQQKQKEEFSKKIAKFATLNKKTFDIVELVHRFNLRGPHFDPTKFNEYTKWMRIYEAEIKTAMNNYDAETYVFFFEEFAKLSLERAGVVNPNCKNKDCECRNYKN